MGIRLQYTLAGGLLALTLALILEGAFGLDLIYAWLIGINVVAFAFYGIDKLNSRLGEAGAVRHRAGEQKAVRVPEFSLLSYALVGGSPAALVAMLVFRHKVSKPSFLFPFFLIAAAQMAVLYYYRDSIPWPWGGP